MPQVKYTTGGTAVAEVGLAVNRRWLDKKSNEWKDEVTFVDVTLWGRTAEIAGEYLDKGRSVLIEGRLSLDSWEDKDTKQKRTKLKVIGENLTMLGSKPEGAGGGKKEGSTRESRSEESPAASEHSDGPAPGGDDVPF